VSAGAYGSPQLLMLSGIGPADHLREIGIETAGSNSPNVGRHLRRQHCADGLVQLAFQRSGDARRRHQPTLLPAVALDQDRAKLSSDSGQTALIHWRSISAFSRRLPDHLLPGCTLGHGFRKTGTPAITLTLALQAPESRGEVRLRSANPADHPRILTNILSQDSEVGRDAQKHSS